jgi:hypothetical protein
MTLQVISEISKNLADCTICTGIVLSDGERIGAIADIDMFGAFTVDMKDAARKYNRRYPHKTPLKGAGKYDLWTLNKRWEPEVKKEVTMNTQPVLGVTELQRRFNLGLDLFGDGSEDSKLSEDERNFKGIEDEDFENSTDDE